ncbi:MAG: C10 family peptidase, partial [Bacteroidales bacterium]|nr:C10 family peptidase [Bacteroidales bacterium]
MKRFLLPIAIVVLLIVSLPSWLEAAPVDTAVAKQVAINFFHSKSSAQPSVTPTLVYVAREQVGTTKGYNPSIYIYNVGNGFVILSADDRVKPVLAYSTESNFDTANMPDALREWMDETRQQIKSVFLHGTTQGTRNQTLWRDLYENTSQQDREIVRGPLLSTQWNQNAYYNNLCPVDATGPNGHTYAGCVATMMAQVLRYWQYPSAGFGSKFYNIMTYGTQYVNFANAHYNYSLMPNSLTAYSPSNQINEVAKLIYHCAVSVSMQFGPGASSAYIEHVNAALQNYFGYLGGTYHNRDNYSDASWIALLKSELNLLRPIMYSGRGSYGGHAFLCDGYDSDDLFHMNWGWGGFDDGFYNLNNLNTTIYDFNSDHTVLIGIHADTPMLMKDVDSFQFFTRSGTQSYAKEVNVHTHMVTDSIQVYAEGNFLVGRDSVNMSHSVKLNPEGQIFYVRYAPALSDNPVTENGRILLSANANTLLDSIQLSGSSYVVHCPPPQALHLSQEGDVVNIQWDEPDAPVSSYHISKDSIPSMSTISFGNSGGLSMECVQRFMTSDIAAYHQKLLTKISFKPMEGADGYTLRVYQGGSCTIGSSTSATLDPGTLVYSQEVGTAGLNMNGLSTVALDTAVIVDASQELWVGVIYKYLNGQNALTPVAYPGMQIPGENDIIGYHYANSTTTNWRLISSFGLSLNNVMIVTLEDAPTAVEGYTVRRDDIQIAQTSTPGYQDIVTSPGQYTYQVITSWDNGCDVVSTGEINVEVPVTYMDTMVCPESMPLSWHGVTFNAADTQIVTLSTVHGADSILVLRVEVLNTEVSHVVATACGSYIWHAHTYTSSGDYTDTLVSAHGCDSIVTLHLTVNHATHGDTTAVACESFMWHGQTYTETPQVAPTYTIAGGNHNGCDSIVTLHLTVNHATHGDTTAVACESFTWHGQTYTHTPQIAPTYTITGGN